MRPPDFWQSDNGIARLLDPFGRIIAAIGAGRRNRAVPYRAPAPVISIGNLTAGGTGKTPVAMDIAARLRARGATPAVLLRGYGGRHKGPLRVDAASHSAADVGDEALLHALHGPTWIARLRAAAAPAAVAAGADVLVLDDGHQHASLAKDLALVVIDGRTAFGNGRLIPAGPLRETIGEGLARADAAVIMGEDTHDLAARLGGRLPILRARLVPGPDLAALRGRKVVAFAGIGRPEKFFQTLHEGGARVMAVHPFDDHTGFEDSDIQPILDEAYAIGAIPVTTAKDAVRLPPDQRQQVNVISVSVEWEDPEALEQLLSKAWPPR